MDENTLARMKEILVSVSKEIGVELISVRSYHDSEMGEMVEVLIDKDYSIDMDTIQSYTDKVNPLLDEIDCEPYTLDISSGGSVKEIPFSDLPKLMGHYLDIKMKKNGETITAKLMSVEEHSFTVLYFIKGRKKNQVIDIDEVESIHMGYKA